MAIHVALHHVTRYTYDKPVTLGPQLIRLRPAPHCRTPILSYSLRVEPEDHFTNWQQDPYANYQARLVFPEKTRSLTVTVDLVAEMAVYNPFDFFLEPEAEHAPFEYAAGLAEDLAPYLNVSANLNGQADLEAGDEGAGGSDLSQPGPDLGPRFASLLEELRPDGGRTIDFLVAVNQALQQRIAYTIRLDPGVQTPEETLTLGSGSCRDTSWLMVNLLRHMGMAARFVSGYLIQLTPDVKAIDGPSGTETDFTDLHAWCEVFLPGAGWIGLDPTSGLLAGEGHIPVACTPSPSGAAPIDGALEACEVQFSHQMSVSRIHESARVTRPYTDTQWAAIDALGQAVDQELERGDVRLTMGGEPTFVSDHDRDGAEWNTAALGPTKRAYAIELAQRLLARYGPGGFLHLGQGKWYPGEQLPRWALSAFWRRDGKPCWTDPALLANEKTDRKRSTADAQQFIEHLAARLGVDTRFVLPGHEDTLYYLSLIHI